MQKKNLAIVIIILALGTGYLFRNQFFSYFGHKLPMLADGIAQSPVVENIKQDISAPPPLRAQQSGRGGQLTVSGVISQTNLQRKNNGGLAALAENAKLDAAAQAKLQDMFAQQYFEHVSPQGKGPSDLADAAGYRFIAIGENLALGNFENDQVLVQAWMDSPGHRANILNTRYEEIGVAVGKGMYEGQMVWLAVQEFGKPASSCPSVDTALRAQIDSYKQDVSALAGQIQQMKDDLEARHPQTQTEIDAYNQEVVQYNDVVKSYNNKVDTEKQLVSDYNSQVKAYNACIGQ